MRFKGWAWAAALGICLSAASSERPPVRLNAGDLHPLPADGARGESADLPEGPRVLVVQAPGPITPRWRRGLDRAGLQVLSYLPQNAYLVYGDGPRASKRLRRLGSPGAALAVLPPAYKIQPRAILSAEVQQGSKAPAGEALHAIQMALDPRANAETLALLGALGAGDPVQDYGLLGYRNVVLLLPSEAVEAVAGRPDVVSVDLYAVPEPHDERQAQILAGHVVDGSPSGPGYLDWLLARGFSQASFVASGFVVDVSDSGVDNGTLLPNHFGLYEEGIRPGASRVAYARLVGTPHGGSTLAGCDGHGTLNAHVAAGYSTDGAYPHADPEGYRYGLGICPFVRIGSSVIFDPTAFTHPNYAELLSRAYADGARISSNSWGSPAEGAYTIDAQAYDALVRDAQPDGSPLPAAGNQEMVVVFSAGNLGPASNTVGAPGTAKNVITVGASENVRAFGGNDQCGVGDGAADNAGDVAPFSSRGPCDDGRSKPDVVAPGTHVTGGVVQAASPPALGQADPCFNAAGVCAGPFFENFWPLGQQWTTASSGTSHAAPAVAGAAALLRQRFLDGGMAPPSPAMTKAFLVNAGRRLLGAGSGAGVPSDSQGWGMPDLGKAFDGAPRFLRDQVPEDIFTAPGQERVFVVRPSDPGQALRITLAWTDAPGSTVGPAYANDLDLQVTAGGRLYLGNVFSGEVSQTGGSPDGRNNVEGVVLPAGTGGPVAVRVRAAHLPADGVPNFGGATDQDFALVVANGVPESAPVFLAESASLEDESCKPGNGSLDPGEGATIRFALRNVGNQAAGDVSAELLAGQGVLDPGASQSLGPLPPGGPSASAPFSLQVDPDLACGETVTAVLALSDGSSPLGEVSFDLPTGDGSAVCCVPLTCSASAVPHSGQAPLTVAFDGAAFGGTGGAISWLWDFGDGSPPSAEQDPVHVYAIQGQFTWRMTVTDGQNVCEQTGEVSAYRLALRDDRNRSQLCVNSATGEYVFTLLSGAQAGQTFAGTGVVANGGTQFWTEAGDPNSITATLDLRTFRARAYFSNSSQGVYSALVDSNIGNNPPPCSW